MSKLRYSATEPYVDSNSQRCILAYDIGTERWQKFTSEDFHQPGCEEDIVAWNEIFNNCFWRLPGDLNFPEGIPKPDDLKEIHRCLVSFINSRVWFRDKKTSVVLANWIILSYFRDKFDFIPLVIMDGATYSGKSTLGKVLMAACYRGLVAKFTPASIVHIIGEFHTSVFLDEFFHFSKKDRVNVIELITSNVPYIRKSSSKSSRRGIKSYNTKTSAAISIKDREIPEDLVNRGIRIQMFPKPNDVDLESSRINEDEPIDGSYSLREIRAKLTALKISMEIRNIDNTYTDWSDLISEKIKEAHEMLTTKAENGELRYSVDYGLENVPITNRLDIATTMLSIAMLTGTERDTIEFILNSNAETEGDYDSFEGEVLRGFVDVLQDRIDNAPLSRNTLTDIIRKITTREIAQRVNNNMHDNGDLHQWDNIETRKVTNVLKTLGITYTVGKGAGDNQSTIDPTTPGFFEQLEMLIKRYDPGYIDIFEKLKR